MERFYDPAGAGPRPAKMVALCRPNSGVEKRRGKDWVEIAQSTGQLNSSSYLNVQVLELVLRRPILGVSSTP